MNYEKIDEIIKNAQVEWGLKVCPKSDQRQQNKVLAEIITKVHNSAIESCEEEIESERITPQKRYKSYDGDNLNSACDFYGIATTGWNEIIRYEDGHNEAISTSKEKLEKLKIK